jgi:phosphatidylserine decarboxylase
MLRALCKPVLRLPSHVRTMPRINLFSPARPTAFNTLRLYSTITPTPQNVVTPPDVTATPQNKLPTEPIVEKKKKKKHKSSWKYRFAVLGAFIGNLYFILGIISLKVMQSEEDEYVLAENQLALFAKLPLNGLSRLWGAVYSTYVPTFGRSLFYNIYAYLFDANLDDVELPLHHYESLQAFFTRRMKKELRPVSEDDLVCPVDGRIVAFGKINSENEYMIEQVKGIKYPVEQLLDMITDEELKEFKTKNLYYCVFYLAPGDYHRYHSPAELLIHKRKHIPGYLFPVMPVIVKTIRGLFALNERVVLDGTWKQGVFHYVIVGATNVGSIVVNFDNSLQTNLKPPKKPKKKKEEKKKEVEPKEGEEKKEEEPKEGEEKKEEIIVVTEEGEVETKKLQVSVRRYQEGGLDVNKGEEIGYFKMGSTIILVFEHNDPNFELSLKKGQRVYYGQSLLK